MILVLPDNEFGFAIYSGRDAGQVRNNHAVLGSKTEESGNVIDMMFTPMTGLLVIHNFNIGEKHSLKIQRYIQQK